MSNSYTSPPTLTDPSRLTAAQTIRSTEISRMSDLANYCFATGGTHNIVSQLFDDLTFIQDNTSTFVTMAEYVVPRISNHHNALVVNIQAYSNSAANPTVQVNYTIGGIKYTASISITDQNRYISSFNSGTISITGTHAEEYGLLSIDVKAVTGADLVVLGIQANWQALSSPLTTGELLQYTDVFTPIGQNRQGADLPLTSRWGVQMLENINTLRRRPRVLFNWSGIRNASTALAITAAGAGPKAIGRGDLSSFYSEAAIFMGTSDDNNLKIRVWVNLENYTSGSISFDVMGNALILDQAGWQYFDIDLVQDELPRSNQFGLSMYQAGADNTPSQINAVASPARLPSATPYIAGMCIVGV